MWASVEDAFDMGCAGVGATIYFGSEESPRQIREISQAFARAHELGMFTILWCYVRNENFRINGKNYEASADLTGQANHMGVTIEADIIKQKQPTLNGGYRALNMGDSSYGKLDEKIYTKLATDHPIDLTRYQVANCYMGRCGLINSGGGSGKNDLQQVVRTAVINKRAGGMGLISGRKAFQKPMDEGVEILNAIQNVYLDDAITVA
jgi:class I fructose-bisphosphate aldolase